MIALDGLLLTLWFPIAVISLGGIGCFWKYRHGMTGCVLCFLVAVFLLGTLWRIPVVIDRRYMLPLIVPGILFATLFIKWLSGQWTGWGKWLCGILLLIMGMAGIAKAMRVQEPKPYLKEIPDFIHEDIQSHQWHEAFVLVLGRLGGRFEFNDQVRLDEQHEHLKYYVQENQKQFHAASKLLEPEWLLLQYPVFYIVVTSKEAGAEFARSWHAQYGRLPELCYEFIRTKNQMRYQLFRVISPYRSAWLNKQQRLQKLQQFNLLPNPEFSQYNELPEDSPLVRGLLQRGIAPYRRNGCIGVPSDWKFNMNTWQNYATPAGWEYTAQQKFRIFSKNNIALYQASAPFRGGKIYQLGGELKALQASVFYVQVIRSKAKDKESAAEILGIVAYPGEKEFSACVDLSDYAGTGSLQFGLIYGDIELSNIYLVDQAVFNDIPREAK